MLSSWHPSWLREDRSWGTNGAPPHARTMMVLDTIINKRELLLLVVFVVNTFHSNLQSINRNIMADDMANAWGTNLVSLPKKRGKKRSGGHSETLHDEFDFTNLNDTIKKDTGSLFHLCKATPNGSDANLFACTTLTEGNNEGLLIAAGSYVAGDYGAFHAMSTAKFSLRDGPSYIQTPVEVESDFTRKHTVGLPYHIPKTIRSKKEQVELEKYEDAFFVDLHNRLLTQRMKGKAITCLLVEICLANNGAELSDRALSKLGELAKHHKFSLVVDEIMTSARTGTMLYTTQKPKIFYEAVAYVTIGKWPKMGLVLASKKQYEKNLVRMSRMDRRGQSTSIDCSEAELFWKAAIEELPNTAARRAAALKKLHVKEEEAWGNGIHIFAPVKRTSPGAATWARFLPMLEDTPFDSIKVQRKNVPWCMDSVNKAIMEQCSSWLEQDHWNSFEELDYNMLASTLSQKVAGHFFSSQWAKENVLTDASRHSVKYIASVLRKAEEAGLIAKVKINRNYNRGWEVQEYSCLPW